MDLDPSTPSIDIDNAKLLTITISLDEDPADTFKLQFGTPTAGLLLNSGTLRIAILSATDGRTWRAIQATGIAATFAIPGLTAAPNVTGGLSVNQGPTPLNWATQIDLDAADATFAATPVLDLSGAKVAANFDVTNIDLFGVFSGGLRIALETDTVDVSLDGTTIAFDNAQLLTLTVSLDEDTPAAAEDFKLSLRDVFTLEDGTLKLQILTAGTTHLPCDPGDRHLPPRSRCSAR